MKILKYFWAFISLISIFSNPVLADRLKDLTSLAGVRSNQLVGYGVVVGLAGTGDGNTGITLQSMQSLVSRFGVTSEVEGLNGNDYRRFTAIYQARTVNRRHSVDNWRGRVS